MTVWKCFVCDADVPDYKPEYCCYGNTYGTEYPCGCMGMPIEPPLCSVACEEKIFGKSRGGRSMTREDILAMEPGRELDAKVALAVMGFKEITIVGKHYFTDPIDRSLNSYSTDISAAWEVITKMKEKNWWIALNAEDKEWSAMFYWDPHKQAYECTAKTAPEAICKAALLAVMDSLPIQD